jgi:uncharacterized protein
MTSDLSRSTPLSASLVARAGPATGTSLLIFFVLTYAVSWTFFIAVSLLSRRASAAIPLAILQLLLLPGVFAPALVAIALTARVEGRRGSRALTEPLCQWRVGGRWFVFAACYTVAIKISAAVILRLATGVWPRSGSTPWYLMVGAILVSTPVQAGEEIGWRGFALPRLATRMGFAGAGILLGLVWACWHLPLFSIPQADTYGQSFIVYLLQVTGISVAIAWLYFRTRQSLLLPMLMHAAVNNTKDVFPSAMPGVMNTFGVSASPMAWLTVILLWICAAYFLWRMRGPLSATTRKTPA